jgi:hypothetical protein
MSKDRMIPAIIAVLVVSALFAVITPIYALTKQTAAVPGEVLDSDGDETTPAKFWGVFAYEVTSTGVGTILIQRSEDNSTYMTVKTLTNTSAADKRGYLYEAFGDIDQSSGVYYKAVMSGDPSSGSFRFRFVK